MNRDRAKELLPIIQAYADGEDVEYRLATRSGKWHAFASGYEPNFYEGNQYRIKPKPVEAWAIVDKADNEIWTSNQDEIRTKELYHNMSDKASYRVTKLVEADEDS